MTWAQGRHALITGGGTGIGAATARLLAAAGAKLSLVGRRPEPIEAVAAQTGGKAFPCDLTDRAAMEAAFAAAREANGPFDFVILNAGMGDSASFGKTPRETWDRVIATNLTALFDGAQLALPDLVEGDDKRLIIVASVAGLKGVPRAAPYSASKHGAIGFARSLALEFARTGLTVNAVCPGFVDTPMNDETAARIVRVTGRTEAEAQAALAALNANGRIITADEIAASIVHLLRPDSRSITGACITIDGGTTA